MDEWHHRLSGHEFEQAPVDGRRLGSPMCCCLWGHKEPDMTEQLNKSSKYMGLAQVFIEGQGKQGGKELLYDFVSHKAGLFTVILCYLD